MFQDPDGNFVVVTRQLDQKRQELPARGLQPQQTVLDAPGSGGPSRPISFLLMVEDTYFTDRPV